MNIDACLQAAVDGKEITEKQAKDLRTRFEQLARHKKPGGEAIAGEAALKQMVADLKAESANKRRHAKLAARRLAQIDADIRSHRRPDGKADIAGAAEAIVEHNGGYNFDNVAFRQKAIEAMAHGKMEIILSRFQRGKLLGDMARQNKADLANVVRELFGEDTGDAKAKELAKAWKETAEWMRQQFNAAGGAIGKLDNWGLPQRHDADALRNVGREKWKADIGPMLDLRRMKHRLSGRDITEDEFDGMLDEIFDTVTTDGWIERQPSMQQYGKGALANQHGDHRFLVFRDADTWLEYQKLYGGGDPFAAMMTHVATMSKDIAALEILGPNPDAMIRYLQNVIQKERKLALAGQASLYAGRTDVEREATIEGMWQSYRGTLNTPVNTTMAAVFTIGRQFVSSVALGGAVLSSLTDVNTSLLARKFAGLNKGSLVTQYMEGLTQAGQERAIGSSLTLESAAHTFNNQARYAGRLNKWVARSAYINDRILTISGLTPFTQAGRHAHGLETMQATARYADKSLADLKQGADADGAAFADMLGRYGFRERDWDMIRAAKRYQYEGKPMMVRPNEIDLVNPEVAKRFLSMIYAEMEFAVPTGSHRARAAMTGGLRKGTLRGEALHSFMQFKNYPITLMYLHGQRTHMQLMRGGLPSAAAYAASVMIMTFIGGSVSLQLKDMVAGRKPRDMTTSSFLGAAMLQGGGLGIWGDFLFSDINRYGGSMGGNIGGPLFEKANDFWNLTMGNMIQAGAGEKTDFGKELNRFVRNNVPGNNIWYTRLAWERVLMDSLQRVMDPEADKAFRRQVQKRQKDYGQGYWWAPGQAAPAFMQN